MDLGTCEVKVAGYYTFYINGEEVFSTPSKNLITNYGWDRLFNIDEGSLTSSTILQLGTGNTPPAVTDTALVSLLASQTGTSADTAINGTDTVGVYRGARYTYVFAQGAVVGNVAEVGWKVAAADTAVSSRSLVKDGLGNPATIVVTAIDQLTVIYETRYYLNRTLTNSGTVIVAGVSTSYTLMAAADDVASNTSGRVLGYRVGAVSVTPHGTGFTMGSVGNNPAGGEGAPTILALSGVSTNSATNTQQFTFTFNTAQANLSGGILGIKFSHQGASIGISHGNLGTYKVSFSPAIPKDNTKTCAFTFTLTFTRL